jgi:hypothetical protein
LQVGRDGWTLLLPARGDSLCGSAEVGSSRPPGSARQGNSTEAPGGCESSRRLPHALVPCAVQHGGQPSPWVAWCAGDMLGQDAQWTRCVSLYSSRLWVCWPTRYAHTTSGERAPWGARVWVGVERKVQSSDTCRGGSACGIADVVLPSRDLSRDMSQPPVMPGRHTSVRGQHEV